MPLSPELRKRLQIHAGVADAASEDELLAAVANTLDTQKTDMTTLVTKTKSLPALSADVDRLTKERDAAKADAEAKDKQVIALSADVTKKLDPLIADGIGEVVGAKFELAIAAGFPAKAIEALDPILRDADGRLNLIALSACPVPVGDGKTTKPGRVALALAEWAKKVAAGEYGEGVPLGAAKGAVTLSAGGAPEKPLSFAEYSTVMAQHGHSVTQDDYTKYQQRRGASAAA